MCRTAPLTSKCCILYIYSTNTGTGYFKHALYSPFFFSSKCSLFHNANLFGSCIIHILYTGVLKIKKNNSGAKRLNGSCPESVFEAVQEKGHPVTSLFRHRGEEGLWLQLIRNLSSRRCWVTSTTSRLFTPGKETRCPLHRRLGGPQGRSGGARTISRPLGFDPRTVRV